MSAEREDQYVVGERGPGQPVFGLLADYPEISTGLAQPLSLEDAQQLRAEKIGHMPRLVIYQLVEVGPCPVENQLPDAK